MRFPQAIIVFLCDQKKWLIYTAIILSQLLIAADIENAILSPRVSWQRAFFGIIATELLACLVMTPSLLLLFRIVARFAELLGTMRATLLTVAVIFSEEILTRTTRDHMFMAPNFALDIVAWVLMSAAVLFVVKGKERFFERSVVSEGAIQSESRLQPNSRNSDGVSDSNERSSVRYGMERLSLQQHLALYARIGRATRMPFVILVLALSCIFLFYQFLPRSQSTFQKKDELQSEVAMSDQNAEKEGRNRIITPELAEAMSNGSKFDFSGCIGKSLTECIEGATYGKAKLDGIELHFQVSPADSCGPQARFLAVLGPKGGPTSGCWIKNGEEVKTWIFTTLDANGNYRKVSGPTVRFIELMPYYKTHNLPEDVAPGLTANAAASVPLTETVDFDETDECQGGLKRFVIGFSGSFTDENRQAIRRNCASKRSEWLCFIEKAGDGDISAAEKNQIEIACNLNE